MGGLLDFIVKSLFGGQIEESAPPTASESQSSPTYFRRVMPNYRNDRIEKEILMVAPRFAQNGGIHYDEENKDWLMIPRYPLPERWKERWCKLLIIFPNTYPETPPIGFYLNRKFHLKGGGSDSHFTGQAYHGAPDLKRQGWYWYCVTIQNGPGGWQPSTDYRQPDNIFSFLTLIRETLTSDF